MRKSVGLDVLESLFSQIHTTLLFYLRDVRTVDTRQLSRSVIYIIDPPSSCPHGH
jgi:hypothetical protein